VMMGEGMLLPRPALLVTAHPSRRRYQGRVDARLVPSGPSHLD
jgi:hypothetical protein